MNRSLTPHIEIVNNVELRRCNRSVRTNPYIVLLIFANEPSFHWIQLFKNNKVVFQLDPVVTMKIARRLCAATHKIVTKETNFYRNNMRKHSHN